MSQILEQNIRNIGEKNTSKKHESIFFHEIKF